MKKLMLLIGCCLFLVSAATAQRVGISTNLLGWAAYGTMNIGAEPALCPNLTLAVDGYYNPYTFSGGESSQMWGAQGELRYWLKTKFTGHYLGAHGYHTTFDFGMDKYRYDGTQVGAGISYGYALPIAARWRLTFSVGAGWKGTHYGKEGLPQRQGTDIDWYGYTAKNTFGITKAAINVQFLIR